MTQQDGGRRGSPRSLGTTLTAPPSDAPPAPLAITWVGHATVLVEIDGIRMITDPVLRDRIGPLTRIAPPAVVGGPVDCVLLSHLHADHTDLPTLRALDRAGPLVAPHEARDWLIANRLRNVREIRAGGEIGVGGVRVAATAAVHDRKRWPIGPRADPIGYVLRGSSSVYFAGDTALFLAMADLRRSVDVALVPIWGWGSSVGAGHLDPESAATAVALIAPAVTVPIHWGTFALRRPARRLADPARPAREFERLVKRYAPAVEVRVLSPGERTVVTRA